MDFRRRAVAGLSAAALAALVLQLTAQQWELTALGLTAAVVVFGVCWSRRQTRAILRAVRVAVRSADETRARVEELRALHESAAAQARSEAAALALRVLEDSRQQAEDWRALSLQIADLRVDLMTGRPGWPTSNGSQLRAEPTARGDASG